MHYFMLGKQFQMFVAEQYKGMSKCQAAQKSTKTNFPNFQGRF